MKILFPLFTLLMSFNALAVTGPGYEPYQFQCVYEADGPWQATSKVVADNDDWTFLVNRHPGGEIEKMEAESAFIVYPDEDMPREMKQSIERLAKLLKIDRSKWFTTTEITLRINENAALKFYKFNSKNGMLGVGVKSEVFGNEYFTKCE